MRGKIKIYLLIFLAIVILPAAGLLKCDDTSCTETGKVFRIYDTGTSTIINVPDKDFIIGAIPCEMPLSYEDEALKAQGIAAYTYYSKLRETNKDNDYDFSANVSSWYIYVTPELMKDRWGDNYDEYYGRLENIEKDIDKMVLTYDGDLITSTYYAVSSGNTESSKDIWGGEREYLSAVASPWDMLDGSCCSTATFSETEVRDILKGYNIDLNCALGDVFTDIDRSKSGSVLSAVCCGSEMTGEKIREAFSLRSQNFTVSCSGDQMTFNVRGYGHGVGMSQTGANVMAKLGYDYNYILSWYYKGANITQYS